MSFIICHFCFLQVEFETEMMKDKRDKLTQLLMDLMERQKQRAEDLQVHFISFHNTSCISLISFPLSQRMMGEMETTRVEEQENYWLIQYQKLLDSKPKGLEEAEGSMDPKVIMLLMLSLMMLMMVMRLMMLMMMMVEDKLLEGDLVATSYPSKYVLPTFHF